MYSQTVIVALSVYLPGVMNYCYYYYLTPAASVRMM